MTNFKESDVLNRLMSVTRRARQILEGVNDQDDAAVISVPPGRDLCATTDFVRGTGFKLYELRLLTPYDIGRYLVAANVSDLAAMGATPLAFLSVVRYSPTLSFEDVDAILSGIDDACEEFACPLVGGDSGSYHADVLSGTALGTVPSGRYLARKNARPGDLVFVSGEIGGAAAALSAALSAPELTKTSAFAEAQMRWRCATPRVQLGEALISLPHRIACMDVSDGLTASLQQLGRIASLGFEIDLDRLPVADSTRTLASHLGRDPIHLACSASVDFELMITCDPRAADDVLAAGQLAGVPVSQIGRCNERGLIAAIDRDGTIQPMPGIPWDHQYAEIKDLFGADR